jgi:hypothetical protein
MSNRNFIASLALVVSAIVASSNAEARTIAGVGGHAVPRSDDACIGPFGGFDFITNTCNRPITVCWALPVDAAANFTVRIFGQQAAQNNVACFVDTEATTGGEGTPGFHPAWNTLMFSGVPSSQNFPITVISTNDLLACCTLKTSSDSVFMLNF